MFGQYAPGQSYPAQSGIIAALGRFIQRLLLLGVR